MTDRLSHMSTETLQIIMILRLNKSLWPNEKIVQEILDKLSEEERRESEDDNDASNEEDDWEDVEEQEDQD